MKKLLYFSFAVLSVSVFVSLISCGPGAAEKARMDSIRIADSLRVIDSIKIADSLKAVHEAEMQREAFLKKVDEMAAAAKTPFVLKLYELNKVVTANEGQLESPKYITIHDIVSGTENKIKLKDSELYGPIVDIRKGKTDKQFIVKLHCGGSGPFYFSYVIDAETNKIIRVIED